jgi:hypothetical protein
MTSPTQTTIDNMLFLPVSLGEAIDKLTILDIKMDKITDDRRIDVKNEYDLLYSKLKEFIIKYENLYQTMKKVNLLIWDMMDLLRDGNLNEQHYLKVCKDCIDHNDIRFRVKNKINNVSMSVLKEQKSYKTNRLLITINADVNENPVFINIVKYFSFMYDEINIISDLNIEYLQKYFEYDNTILFKIIAEEYKSSVVIEEKEYTENEFYKLFNISEFELQKII